ncbi:MAG: molybdopterin cofactor-binding domain-containing protein [Bacillota bacterium]
MADALFFTVNGKKYCIENPGSLTLLKYLREHLGLMGTKNGCSQGHCGTCTVIVDGKAKRACLLKVQKLKDSSIETIENLSKDGKLHPIQEAFIKEGAVQCGFCTPGMVMAAKALLDVNTCPTEEEIKDALKFNICRCTGYAAIIRAVNRAARVMRGEEPVSGDPYETGIGQSPIKKDAREKVTGKPIFADDLQMQGMLYGKLLLSTHPFARIKWIDISQGEVRPGVVKILTARDIPGRNAFGLLTPHQPVLAGDVVRYMGDPVAVVFAESEEMAEAALKYIKVEYEPLKGIFAPEDGMARGAHLIHESGNSNLVHHVPVRRGNVEKAFAEADVIIEGIYSTPMVEHAYLEPESALARVDDEGVINVWTASQGSFAFREMIAASLDIPEEQVRVIYTPAGGAFGGKEEPTVQIHCALGAKVTGRPVKMTLTRQESLIMSTKRHWERMYYRHGATKDGRITAVEARVLVDAGAYDSLSKPVVFRSAVVAAGPYDIPNVHIDSYGIYTNHPPGGAFRGFGSTQVAFGAEQQVDRIARALNMDPFEIRRINGLREGKATITGQVLKKDAGYLETLEEVEKALAAYKKNLPKASPGKKIGIGVASSYKNVGLGAGKKDRAGAEIELSSEGIVYLKVGATDMGQGSDTALAQIAAEATGIHYDDFVVVSNDTAQSPDGGVTTASRQTYISGHAVLGAAKKYLEVFNKFLLEECGIEAGDYEMAPGGIKLTAKGQGQFISFQELGERAAKRQFRLQAEYLYVAPTTYPLRERADHEQGVPLEKYDIHFAYCFNTQAAVVEVDENTGEVKVLKVIAAQDLGRAIHPQNSRCQIEGAIVMGIGYGLSEEFKLEDGRMITDNLAKLRLPKITQVPQMETILVEQLSDGPFGAKGMGEVPINSTAPAVISAIYDAVGVRIADLPATREKVLAALKAKQGK